MGLAVTGLFYPNLQPYSERARAFGLRSSSKLLTLSAVVKPELLYLKYGVRARRGGRGGNACGFD